MNGKGSRRRPALASDAEVERRWTETFGGAKRVTREDMDKAMKKAQQIARDCPALYARKRCGRAY